MGTPRATGSLVSIKYNYYCSKIKWFELKSKKRSSCDNRCKLFSIVLRKKWIKLWKFENYFMINFDFIKISNIFKIKTTKSKNGPKKRSGKRSSHHYLRRVDGLSSVQGQILVYRFIVGRIQVGHLNRGRFVAYKKPIFFSKCLNLQLSVFK